MKIVVTAATLLELKKLQILVSTFLFKHTILFHVSGVGILPATVSLMKMISKEQPDLVMQIGIAGSFDKKIKLGEVVAIKEDAIIDGVEEKGVWNDIFDLKLTKPDAKPFYKKKLVNREIKKWNKKKFTMVNAMSVSEISVDKKRIDLLQKKYNSVVESMEGAALHYICLDADIPFLQLRSISNYVGERNKANWKLEDAIENVSNACMETLMAFENNMV